MKEQHLAESNNYQIISSEILSEYVAGAVEMETQIFTLEETIKNHQKERDDLETKNKQEFNMAKRRHSNSKQKYDVSKERLEIYSYKTYLKDLKSNLKARTGGDKFAAFLGWAFVHYFFGAFIICLLTMALRETIGNDISIVSIIMFGAILWFSIFFNVRFSIRQKRYKREKASLEVKHLALTNELKKEEENLNSATDKYSNNLQIIKKFDDQITFLEESVKGLKKNLDIYYQKNIIPPDYRNLSCIVLISYVFRNNQADTMREATLLCDQRIRHEINIQALKELSETMRGIGATLNYMQSNIDSISRDITSIASAQNILISETKASRYAAESLKSSTERLEWEILYKK